MKTTGFIFAALLGLGTSTAAFAQTVPVTPGAIATPGTPGGVVTGQPGTTVGTVPNSTVPGTLTTPAGTAAPAGAMPGTVYSPGTTTVPNATLDATQPVGTNPATQGATRRTTTGGRNTTIKTVRP
jgi:hypothetical protein